MDFKVTSMYLIINFKICRTTPMLMLPHVMGLIDKNGLCQAKEKSSIFHLANVWMLMVTMTMKLNFTPALIMLGKNGISEEILLETEDYINVWTSRTAQVLS